MKKFTLIFALLMSATALVMAQPQLSFRFANYQVINAGAQLQFDVEVKADIAGSFHRDLQIYFDYNTAGFGSDIVLNGNLSYTPLALMANATKYDVVNMADNTSSKFAIITEALKEMDEVGSATWYDEITTSYQGLLQFTMNIAPGANTEMCGIVFDQALMNGGQYYQSTSLVEPLKYDDPSIYEGDISTLKLSTLYGTITYANAGSTPLSGVTVQVGGLGTALTDVSGMYQYAGLDDGAYTLTSTTSLPYSYVTNLADVNVLVSHLLGTPLVGIYYLAGEVSGDGIISLADYNLMVSNLLGTLVGYPAVPDWRFMDQSATVTSGIGTKSFEGVMSGDTDGSW